MTYNTLPWVEKHRPHKISNIIQHDTIKEILNTIKETGNMPHLLLYGPPGTGKTSCIVALSMELFGPKIYNDRVLELNASDERGINVVRNKIIRFAKISLGTKDNNFPCPDFKIIILDEADAMTTEAQSALRKVLESTTNITRFVFICNYDYQILDSIKSRCSSFKFKEIMPDYCIKKLKEIALEEKLSISDEALDKISIICQGDIRRGINILQNLQYIKSDIIQQEDVNNITSYIDEKVINKIWNILFTSDINTIVEQTNNIINKGYPIFYIFDSILNKIEVSDITDKQKAKIIIYLSKCENKILIGSNESIQLISFFTYVNGLIKHNIE